MKKEVDIKFFTGVALVVCGQFVKLQSLIIMGWTIESNAVQITGAILCLWHVVLIVYLQITESRKKK